MQQLVFAIASVICFWRCWKLRSAKDRGLWQGHWHFLFFTGSGLGARAGVGLPSGQAQPGDEAKGGAWA